ncbi:Craniofacial development protein 2 [Eumeta japonica]|uniref:Craniofacial development protein 2 n=1 Tax=Eumeta variegata TaxID=151549 RepID=A0A4C1YXH4_EUMVA|nr:Craniofacial development protein 2 [Eumeta japonica]
MDVVYGSVPKGYKRDPITKPPLFVFLLRGEKLITKKPSDIQKSEKRKRDPSYSPNQNQQPFSAGPKKIAAKNAFEFMTRLGEVRRKGCNIEEHQEYILCYIGETTGLYGVGFLVKKIHKQNIVSFTGISERVAVLKLKYEHELLTLVQAYAPTEQASEEETDEFYNDIRKAQENQDRNVIVMGDFNARVGQPKKYEKFRMGNFGYGKRNERGNKLVQYAYEQKLSIMNTYFKKDADRRWTWISPDQKTVNEIDYIMCNKPKQITNTEVLNNVPFPSDHRLLRSSFSLKSPKKSRKTYSSSPKLPKSVKIIVLSKP